MRGWEVERERERKGEGKGRAGKAVCKLKEWKGGEINERPNEEKARKTEKEKTIIRRKIMRPKRRIS